jgi:lysophospholipase L1-like esterase
MTESLPLSYLALGDSYTIGEAVPMRESFPIQLAELLKSCGFLMAMPQIIAKTGWTTKDLLKALGDKGINPPYDLVSLLIGVNNQYQGRDIEEYRREFEILIGLAIEYSGSRPAHVLVLSIPDWGVTPFAAERDRAAIGAEIACFNRVNLELAHKFGASYVDIFPESRQALKNPAFVANDGLHPSGKEYHRWALASLEKLKETWHQKEWQRP